MSDTVRLIQQDSGQMEWWTPQPIIDAARAVMGGIDLDPASSAAANERVGATRLFTIADDGLTRAWGGRVWMNPPFYDNARFIRKLVAEHAAGHVTEACVITFASLDTAWARMLMCFPRWYPEGRIAYVPGWEARTAAQPGLPGLTSAAPVDLHALAAADGSPPKASMVSYLGPDDGLPRFARAFLNRLGGTVDVPFATHLQALATLRLDCAAELERQAR
jgi:ParB family chromosome partitioning protein